MRRQSLDAFREKLSLDAALRRDLARAGRPNAGVDAEIVSVEALVAFAKSHGYDFSAEDVDLARRELGDGELDQVSGGAWCAKFDGVDGSAKQKDAFYKGWIEIQSFSLGARQSPVGAVTGTEMLPARKCSETRARLDSVHETLWSKPGQWAVSPRGSQMGNATAR